METEPSLSQPRDVLVETLRRFSLTYEQHQLLRGPGIGLLASKIATKRRRFTVLLALLAVFFLVQASRGILSTGSCAFSVICFALCSFWWWKRYAKTKALRVALEAFAATEVMMQSTPGTLADELQLGFSLEYDEHQALNAGDAGLAAIRIVARCKANTRTSITFALAISALGLLRVFFSFFADAPIYWSVLVWLSMTLVLTVCVIAIAISDKATITRVENLLRKHQPDSSNAG